MGLLSGKAVLSKFEGKYVKHAHVQFHYRELLYN
jgi:hypothetical protein